MGGVCTQVRSRRARGRRNGGVQAVGAQACLATTQLRACAWIHILLLVRRAPLSLRVFGKACIRVEYYVWCASLPLRLQHTGRNSEFLVGLHVHVLSTYSRVRALYRLLGGEERYRYGAKPRRAHATVRWHLYSVLRTYFYNLLVWCDD